MLVLQGYDDVLHPGFLVPECRRIGPMAGYTIFGCRFIKQHPFLPNFFEKLVTLAALHVLVGSP
jgi:hypothetical protein